MTIYDILENYRSSSKTEREKGTYFESLIKVFLENDERYSTQFSDIKTYSDWAVEHNIPANDIGVDLVAKNIDESYSAIQCKFYGKSHVISKKDIDSFFSASDSNLFTRRVLVDSTEKGLGSNVENTIQQSSKAFTRISLDDLESSLIKWDVFYKENKVVKLDKKKLRPHQLEALARTVEGFEKDDRGKLFMACGTGKTFTALKIAEEYAGKNHIVLFMVPSLALMNQTVTDWMLETATGINAFSVCSDSSIGKNKPSDELSVYTHDLAFPATTDPQKLTKKFMREIELEKDKMHVVFSTYQSIEVLEKAQKEYGFPGFDLVICDEAHRTTGAKYHEEDESSFVKIHEDKFIVAKKRLYMTATPRIYGEQAKTRADEIKATLYSMDDTERYGPVFYSIKFGQAVELGLLTDYKVIVLTIDEDKVARDVQNRLADDENKLQLDDATKMIGCYRALVKDRLITPNPEPMKRAVAFCKNIAASKEFAKEFGPVVKEYVLNNEGLIREWDIESDHIDGTMNASLKGEKLSWLKAETNYKCRILSNAKCLSEGVDVPSLDTVMFVHGRKSMVDIVQSVGRVMRKAEGKKLGYIIIPVGIPQGMTAEDVLSSSKDYKVVWDIINALRSHDERLDSSINKIALTDDPKAKIEAIGDKIEIVASVNDLPDRRDMSKKGGLGLGTGSHDEDNSSDTYDDGKSYTNKADQITLNFDTVQQGIIAKLVEKCGTRTYWEDWAQDIAKIAQRHISRIKATIEDKQSDAYKAFSSFVSNLKQNTNDAVTEDEVIEMLAQHIITGPVFTALFEDYDFAANNSMSQSMQGILDVLEEDNINKESKDLDRFFETIRRRVSGIDTAEAKQKIVVELYDKFFRRAFPRLTDRLGIVYTPVECVDFIIHSVNDVLKQEFNQELGDPNTHIIDPFTGTGTFITRLIQSGLLSKEQLKYKYNLREKSINGEKIKTTEIHANELVLLAYYIASVNIEAVYHSIVGGEYKPFEGICLTDTFQLSETQDDLITPQLADNNHRRKIQKKLPIRVFMGNPPYSAGQSSGNDNNQNLSYPKLDESIGSTYEQFGTATNNNSLYDSYIRAIRWASDRIDKYGVIGFITNAGWIDSASADGMRKCLRDEFSSIYIFHLRGNQRTSGELSRKEGGKIFGAGSRTPIAISILIKNPNSKEHGNIFIYDIGDYLSRDDKLMKISELKSIFNISKLGLWREIKPDKYNDWINQRDDNYLKYIQLGNKKSKVLVLLNNYSQGISSSRDSWLYNYSHSKLRINIIRMVKFYNQELQRYTDEGLSKNQPRSLKDAEKYVAKHLNSAPENISWSRSFRYDICRSSKKYFDERLMTIGLYRPFTKSHLVLDKSLINDIGKFLNIFPERGIKNVSISISGVGAKSFSSLISKNVTDYHLLESSSQNISLFIYETLDKNEDIKQKTGFDFDDKDIVTGDSGQKYKKSDAITDEGLKHFSDFYGYSNITKEDLFYYIYGLLHSEDYREKYKDSLTKALPHIPRVKNINDFWHFSKSGRELADLHINYESKPKYKVKFNTNIKYLEDKDFYVTKMKFPKKDQKDKIIYNQKISLSDIPLEAYDYVVNGKSAIEWVMERQGVSTHKDSGIVNDANDWAIETMRNARYPLELLQRIITVSLETQKIVNDLPKLNFESLS